MFKSVGEYLRFICVQGTGRNIPDPAFVGLVAFLVCGMLKSGQFRLHYGVVLFCSLVSSFVSNSSKGVEERCRYKFLSLLRNN